ncbi:MAG: asparagine synthase-related protein [Pseudonocardiaceae bacterium]
MRWFASWHPASTGAGRPPVPAGARQVWPGGPPLWVAGQWDRWEVRTCHFSGFHLAAFGACLATDTELAAAATAARRSGNYTVLAELAGNHVTVVHDEYGVTVVTDLAGLHPVFYTPWTGGTLFASSPLPLADLTRAGLDLEWLAAMLLCPDVPQANVDRSAFAGIRRTRPGHVLTVGPDGLRQRPIPLPLGDATFKEGAQALRSALVTAVQRRAGLGQTMTADLSGGLDSSTLAVLAAGYLPAGLPAITYADPVADNADDLAYAQLCADDEPRLNQIIVTGDQTTLPFLDLDQVPLLDEPSQDTLLFTRTWARLAPAAACGSAIHLSGDGGDAVLVGSLTYLAGLARSGRMRDVVREAATSAGPSGGGPSAAPATPIFDPNSTKMSPAGTFERRSAKGDPRNAGGRRRGQRPHVDRAAGHHCTANPAGLCAAHRQPLSDALDQVHGVTDPAV